MSLPSDRDGYYGVVDDVVALAAAAAAAVARIDVERAVADGGDGDDGDGGYHRKFQGCNVIHVELDRRDWSKTSDVRTIL